MRGQFAAAPRRIAHQPRTPEPVEEELRALIPGGERTEWMGGGHGATLLRFAVARVLDLGVFYERGQL